VYDVYVVTRTDKATKAVRDAYPKHVVARRDPPAKRPEHVTAVRVRYFIAIHDVYNFVTLLRAAGEDARISAIVDAANKAS
jgi:hypothetical protein